MGYKDIPFDGGAYYEYGQLRIPSLSNDCLTIVSTSEYITREPFICDEFQVFLT